VKAPDLFVVSAVLSVLRMDKYLKKGSTEGDPKKASQKAWSSITSVASAAGRVTGSMADAVKKLDKAMESSLFEESHSSPLKVRGWLASFVDCACLFLQTSGQ
jgi:hypothetical protein